MLINGTIAKGHFLSVHLSVCHTSTLTADAAHLAIATTNGA